MSKLSLSETNWINLVFEYKNKGISVSIASKRKTFLFFLGLIMCTFEFRIVSLINPETLGTIPDRIDQIITVTKVFPNQVKKRETSST
jgi:protein TonB